MTLKFFISALFDPTTFTFMYSIHIRGDMWVEGPKRRGEKGREGEQ